MSGNRIGSDWSLKDIPDPVWWCRTEPQEAQEGCCCFVVAPIFIGPTLDFWFFGVK